MEPVKITEKRTITSLASDAKLLITQTNTVDGTAATDVCQASIESLSEAFAEGLILQSSLQEGSIEGYAFDDPSELQALCASGNIGRWLSVGDVVFIPWTDYTPSIPVEYDFPFVVVQIADCYDENNVLHKNALWLMAMYAEPQDMVFDAPESIVVDLTEEPNAVSGWYYWGGSAYTALNLSAGVAIPTTYDIVYKTGVNNNGVISYGYNRWSQSAYRQWLNSDVAPNTGWWTSQHLGDKSPTITYTNKPGWLYGFSSEWKEIFKPVKVQTVTNTDADGGVTDVTYDKFFLPSIEQMYGSPQSAGVEGDYWGYWKTETGLSEPSNGSSNAQNDARKIPSVAAPTGSAVIVRLRSANIDTSNAVWFMSSGGYLYNNLAIYPFRSQPACVIY